MAMKQGGGGGDRKKRKTPKHKWSYTYRQQAPTGPNTRGIGKKKK